MDHHHHRSLIPTHCSRRVLTLGEKRHATVTLADRLMVTDIEVIRNGTWFAVPKYRGTKASQMTHVVYMVKPARRLQEQTICEHFILRGEDC